MAWAPPLFSQEPEANRVKMYVLESQPRIHSLSLLRPSKDSITLLFVS